MIDINLSKKLLGSGGEFNFECNVKNDKNELISIFLNHLAAAKAHFLR